MLAQSWFLIPISHIEIPSADAAQLNANWDNIPLCFIWRNFKNHNKEGRIKGWSFAGNCSGDTLSEWCFKRKEKLNLFARKFHHLFLTKHIRVDWVTITDSILDDVHWSAGDAFLQDVKQKKLSGECKMTSEMTGWCQHCFSGEILRLFLSAVSPAVRGGDGHYNSRPYEQVGTRPDIGPDLLHYCALIGWELLIP